MIEIVHGAAMRQGRPIAAVRPLRLLSEMVSDSVFLWVGQMRLHSGKEKPSRSAMAIATPWANESAFLSPWVKERAKESAFLSFSLSTFYDVWPESALGAQKIF